MFKISIFGCIFKIIAAVFQANALNGGHNFPHSTLFSRSEHTPSAFPTSFESI